MIKRAKRGGAEHAHALWLRVVAYVCVLLVVGASSAQAIHVHGQWLPQKAIRAGALPDAAQLPGGEDNCPLCMAMHSALPAATHVALVRMVLVECKVVQGMNHAPETLWHFAMFSRPPPVETL